MILSLATVASFGLGCASRGAAPRTPVVDERRGSSLPAGKETPASDEPPAPPPSRTIRGKWVLDARGKAVGPDSFRRGLQTSGLAFERGELWSVGDQRSEYPGHLFRIDPETARLAGEPLELRVPAPSPGESPHFAAYREIPNSDFDGLAGDPSITDRLYAVTEDKIPWVAEIRLSRGDDGEPTGAWITRLAEIRFPETLRPWRERSNFRVEGIAIDERGEEAYLAYERASDDLPRLFRIDLQDVREGRDVRLEAVEISFGELPPRADKRGALLNLNDIQLIRRDGAEYLIAVARDQERLLVIDLERRRAIRWIELDLRDPDGNSIYWVSPEGLAFDGRAGRLWIINDPDSVRGNYRRRDEETATRLYAEYAPLLFEMGLSEVFGRAEPRAGSGEPVGASGVEARR